jgi:hypothetical protein
MNIMNIHVKIILFSVWCFVNHCFSFVIFLLIIVLSVSLPLTDSDYPFGFWSSNMQNSGIRLIYSYATYFQILTKFINNICHSFFCINFRINQWLATGQWFSPGTPVSSINETEHYDITEILLKVALITINLFHYNMFYIVSKKHMYVLYFCWNLNIIREGTKLLKLR